jgi:organic hydroperoxide reductase OsmC/OhrA
LSETHRYRAACAWTGSTGAGYEHYDRTHTATAPGVEAALTVTSDRAFRGDPGLWNPEALLVLAASSCQLLSFLAVAAVARIDVISYSDDAEGEMPEHDKPMRVTEIVLRPRITIRGEIDDARVRHLVDVAHRECFIANSLRTDVRIEPRITITA